MALTEEQLKSDLEGYLRKLAGVMPIGHYWFGIDPKSKPAGVQIYSGQLLTRSAYQKHWEFVSGGHRTVLSEEEWQEIATNYGFCPYFSDGDGSTTYRMPLVKGVHPKFVAALVEAGGYTEAGLPNITGTFNLSSGYGIIESTANVSGAFTRGTSRSNGIMGVDDASSDVKFDASKSNSIYGASTTVQPPAVSIVLGEYVVGTIVTIGEANAEGFLTSISMLESLTGALQNGSGFNTVGKREIINWGMPNYNSGVLTHAWGQSTTNTFTAPFVGYVVFAMYVWADSKVDMRINNKTIAEFDGEWGGQTAQCFNFIGAVAKGDVVKIYYDGSNTATCTKVVRFVPMKGV